MFQRALERVATRRIIVYSLIGIYACMAYTYYPFTDYSWVRTESFQPLLILIPKLFSKR
jgi:hypothetical protein